MSPVFRHGRLRLYLLKLLDDAPKHGYEVIRLLQDRFMGVYAPSPGTIYPRLARLEEEGLVTHDEVDGRKVYRLTDKGRDEIRERVDDLAELEQEITESVRDIAREVKEDVRETVRSLREEIAWAARDVHKQDRWQAERARDEARQGRNQVRQAREEARRADEEARRTGEEAPEPAQPEAGEERGAHGERRAGPDAAGRDRQGGARGRDEEFQRAGEEAGARFRSGRGGPKKDWGDWRDWPGWREWPGWRDWPGQHDRPGRGPGAGHGPGWPDAASLRDLERVAVAFMSDLRRLATHASGVGEDTLGDLRTILDEALTRIRTEVFQPKHADDEPAAPDTSPADPGD